MSKYKLTDITNTNSLTEISRAHLNSFLNSTNSEPKCSRNTTVFGPKSAFKKLRL